MAIPNGTGLKGWYYDGTRFNTYKGTRVDASPFLPNSTAERYAGCGSTDFSVRWTGYIRAPITGTVTFRVISDDGHYVWVDGVLRSSQWTSSGVKNVTFTMNMVAGVLYPIKLELSQGTGASEMRLLWSYSGQAEIVIPTANLYPTYPWDTTGDPIPTDGTMPRRVLHYAELRTAISTMIKEAGTGQSNPAPWTQPSWASGLAVDSPAVRKPHVTELRTQLEAIYRGAHNGAGPSWTWTLSPCGSGDITANVTEVIKAQVAEARARLNDMDVDPGRCHNCQTAVSCSSCNTCQVY